MPDVNEQTAAKPASDKIVISKDTAYMATVGVLLVLLVVSIFTGGFGIVKPQTPAGDGTNVNAGGNTAGNAGGAAGNAGGAASGNAQPGELKVFQVPALMAQMPTQGTATNGVTVIEFSDFQCPFCGMAWGCEWANAYASQYGPIIGVVKTCENDYVKAGKANFIHFPVAFLGQESLDASDAALCAKDQGRYFEMHNAIYAAQTPEENSGKYSKANLKLLAKNVTGLDTAKFDACLDANTHLNDVQTLTADATSAATANTGSFGTPTFYVVVDASKASKDKVQTAVAAANQGVAASQEYKLGMTSDKKLYVIIADPVAARMKVLLDGLSS